jgi:hypothetical protein
MKPFVISVVTVLCASLVDQVLASSYSLSNTVVGAGFFDAFIFETIADPSNGTVFVFLVIFRAIDIQC